jgi:metallo-beta-lactamase family protein
MAIEATEVYRRNYELFDREASTERRHNGDLFDLPNLHLTRTAQQSTRINRIESGAIIIAGSGMCEGGRIKHHIKHNIWREKCQLLIVGFQAQGTLGRALVDGAEIIHLWGEAMRVAATIRTIGGFSAHADCHGLAEWYGRFSARPPVVLVHGEPQAMDPFAARLKSIGARQVFTPEHGAALDLVSLKLKS